MTRTVITGLGVVAPTGIGAEEHWRATLAGELCVRPIEAFDSSGYLSKVAGQVRGFTPGDHIDERLIIQTDRWTWFSLAAAQFAFEDAKYDPAAYDPYATSVVLAAGYGGNAFGQGEMQALFSQGPQAVTAYQSIAWFYAASAGQTSIRHGTKGPATVVAAGYAGGLDSLGAARRTVRRGRPTAVAGGTEAPIAPYALIAQITGGQLTASADPRTGYRPFDVDAAGYAPGEGGAILLVEDAATALDRGVPHIYGEIAGYAATHDGHHHADPAPDSRQLARAMRLALADAGVTPDEIGFIVADGAGTPALDALEAAAIAEVFGERAGRVPVTAPQGLVGRLGAGGAPLNVATALLAMRDDVIPAVGNLSRPGDYGLDLVREPREQRTDAVLINARGYGGFNTSIVLTRFPEEPQ